ncbi:MAG: hypothetical protein H6737_05130 [Alphaproteobacteria bacterium]|nr:hypothetical protein [Alphaproteobacteria bacterium]
MLLLFTLAHAADCEIEPTANAIADLLNDATAAYQDLDIERFQARTDEVRTRLPCVSERLPTYVIARLHRTEGLRAFGDRLDWAGGAFAAARAIEPDYRFPKEMIPENHPVLDVYRAVGITPTKTEPVPRPAEGEVRIDGRAEAKRATDRPAVFQRFDATGDVAETAYLLPEMALPPYAVFVETPEPVLPEPTPVRAKPHRIPLIAATAATAVGAASLWGLSAASHGQFNDPTTPDAKLPGLQKRTNSATVSAGVLGGAALVLGATTVVTW